MSDEDGKQQKNQLDYYAVDDSLDLSEDLDMSLDYSDISDGPFNISSDSIDPAQSKKSLEGSSCSGGLGNLTQTLDTAQVHQEEGVVQSEAVEREEQTIPTGSHFILPSLALHCHVLFNITNASFLFHIKWILFANIDSAFEN